MKGPLFPAWLASTPMHRTLLFVPDDTLVESHNSHLTAVEAACAQYVNPLTKS